MATLDFQCHHNYCEAQKWVSPEVVEQRGLVRVAGLSVDCDLLAAVTLSSEKCVKERESSVLYDFHVERDGMPHTIEVV